jgi:CDP-diacylglycerol---serine O-phosphatidyltransferase
VDFRKTYYILPNLFTLSSVFCGFISISLSASGEGGSDLYQAALAICFGFFFDTADGRVARLTKTQTDLGRDLDSLCDLVTFGVAPAMLVYKWGLTEFGRGGIFVAGLFVCAGAMRLARFNVLSRREEAAGHKNPGKYTLGLSIPAAASVLVMMVIVSHNAGEYRGISEGFVAGVVLVLSYLMVSRIRFRSFKDIRFNRKTLGLLLLAVGCAIAVVVNGVDKAFIFLLLITAYIVLGLTETIIFMKRGYVERQQQRRAASAASSAAAVSTPAEEPDAPPPDDEVLRELGAFDPTEYEGEDEGQDEAAAAGARAATGDAPAEGTPGPVGHPKRA